MHYYEEGAYYVINQESHINNGKYITEGMYDLFQKLLDMYFREDRFIKSNFHITLLSLIIDMHKTTSRNYNAFLYDTKLVSRYLGKLIDYPARKYIKESDAQYSTMLAKTLKTLNLLFDEYLSGSNFNKHEHERDYYHIRESGSMFYDNRYIYDVIENLSMSPRGIFHDPVLLLEYLRLINNLEEIDILYQKNNHRKYRDKLHLFFSEAPFIDFFEHEIMSRNISKNLLFEILIELLKYDYRNKRNVDFLCKYYDFWHHFFKKIDFLQLMIHLPKQAYSFLKIINECDILINIYGMDKITIEWLITNGNKISSASLKELLRYAHVQNITTLSQTISEYILKY